MRLLEIRTKVKKQAKTIIFSSLTLSLIVVILGILLLTLREHIVNYIEWAVLILFIQGILLNLFLFWKYKKKRFFLFVGTNLITLIIFIIFYFCTSSNLLDVVAIFMGIGSIINILEFGLELYEQTSENDLRNQVLSILKIFIEFYFAYSLFKNKGESVKAHLFIFGVVFIVKGLESIISILLSKHKEKNTNNIE